jgi:hypothetical protein
MMVSFMEMDSLSCGPGEANSPVGATVLLDAWNAPLSAIGVGL